MAHSSNELASPQEPRPNGPPPGQMKVTQPFISEQCIRHMMAQNGGEPTRDAQLAVSGVQLIDNVREHLQLFVPHPFPPRAFVSGPRRNLLPTLLKADLSSRPVRTFNTACTYFHRFRLVFRDTEYNWQDAAISCLFLACKVEDTIKK